MQPDALQINVNKYSCTFLKKISYTFVLCNEQERFAENKKHYITNLL